MADEKIRKNISYIDLMEEDIVKKASNSVVNREGEEDTIDKNADLSECLKYAKPEIPSIDEFYEERERLRILAEEDAKRKLEEAKKIEEPIDLTEAETEFMVPYYEKRVSYRRTFGITKSRRRDFDKYTTIAVLALSGVLAIISFILSKSM